MTPGPDGSDRRVAVGLDETLGAEFLEVGPDRAVIRLVIGSRHHQPFGIVHGGVYCSLVESSASMAAAAWFADRGNVVGVSNQTDFLRSVGEGTITATATPIHRGRTTQLWEVQVRDDRDRLVARGQVRIANLDNPGRLSAGAPGGGRERDEGEAPRGR